ncbi:MAG: EscF/YscF/HrpA family type III secretion system needle major subunit [Pseudomonadota bacterium]
MSLNMDVIYEKLSQAVIKMEDEIVTFSETMDPANTVDVMKLQQYMQKWGINTQVESNTMKTIGDSIRTMTQNIK